MDDDSLSRMAANATAKWNHQDALDGLNNRPLNTGSSGFSGPAASTATVLVVAALIGGAAGSLGGGEQWYLSSLFMAGVFVGIVLVLWAAYRTMQIATRGVVAGGSVAGRALAGLPAALLVGALLGTMASMAVPMFLGDDIPASEGMAVTVPLGAALGCVWGIRRLRRRG